MATLLRIVLAVVAAVVIIAFAVGNRQIIEVNFTPFPITLFLPLYIVVLVFLFIGIIVGGLAAWLSSLSRRSEARRSQRRANALQSQVAALKTQNQELQNRLRVAEAGERRTLAASPSAA